jgi:hypothetical protein
MDTYTHAYVDSRLARMDVSLVDEIREIPFVFDTFTMRLDIDYMGELHVFYLLTSTDAE